MDKDNINTSPTTTISSKNNDILSVDREYYRIEKAADILHCTADDLLHLGVIGTLEILAPIMTHETYIWSAENYSVLIDGLDEPLHREFGPADRVILSLYDLAQIEGSGSTTPHHFYSPDKALELIEYGELWNASHEEEVVYRTPTHPESLESYPQVPVHKLTPKREDSTSTLGTRHNTILSAVSSTPWIAQPDRHIKYKETTIDHLFVSNKEVRRILSNAPQDKSAKDRNAYETQTITKKAHAGTERHAVNREPMLNAAIYCLAKLKHKCMKTEGSDRSVSAAALAKTIAIDAHFFWKNTKNIEIPCQDVITRRLSKIIQGEIPD